MYDNDLFIDVNDAKKHRDNLERIRRLEHELKDNRKPLQKKDQPLNLTNITNNNVILNKYTPPIKIDHRGNIKGNHFHKTTSKVDNIIELYNSGHGFNKIASELHIAKNSVRVIIQEHKELLKYPNEILSKQLSIKHSKNNIIKALKCLVATDKKSPHTVLELYKLGTNLLQQYLDKQPTETIKLLIGKDTFKVDDLLNAMATIIVKEAMRLNDDLVEISPDTFVLKGTNIQDDDKTCQYMFIENGKWKSCRPPIYSQSKGTIGINQCRGLNNNCPQYTPKTPQLNS
jgi:hypothetical protein